MMVSIKKLNLIVCLLTLLLSNAIAAQTIVLAEYYIDSDPGFGNAITIDISNPSEMLELDIDLPIDIDPGIHTLYIRAKDENGMWSISDGRNFRSYLPYATNWWKQSTSLMEIPVLVMEILSF